MLRVTFLDIYFDNTLKLLCFFFVCLKNMILYLLAETVILVQGLEAQCYETLIFQHFWTI